MNERENLAGALARAAEDPDSLEVSDLDLIEIAARDYLALVGSSDIILIRCDADGNWPKKVRQTVASAIGEAATTSRQRELTADVFVAIQTRLLNELAAL